MKANPIATRVARVITGAFNRAETEAPEVETPARKIDYPTMPAATSQADAWRTIREHRANLIAALAAGLFVSHIS
jgi:hypothetical protein